MISQLRGDIWCPTSAPAATWLATVIVLFASVAEAATTESSGALKVKTALTLEYEYDGQVRSREAIEAMGTMEVMTAAVEAVRHCRLRTSNTPWVIMHGVLAFGTDLMLRESENQQAANGMQFLCDDRHHASDFDYNLFQRSSRGVRILRSPQPHVLQDHTDQLLMIFGRAGIALDTPIYFANGGKGSVKAALEYSLQEVHGRKELAFALPAYCRYVARGEQWVNKYGTVLDIGKLAAALADRPVDGEACFSTHRLYALAICLHRPENMDPSPTGDWIKVRKTVAEAIRQARAHQNADRSFNIPWWDDGRSCGDDSEIIHLHGHMLSWLAVACCDPNAPWMDDVAVLLARTVLKAAPREEVPYGWLAHAVDGLKLHLQNKMRPTATQKDLLGVTMDSMPRIERGQMAHEGSPQK